ncbi:polysaccharide deacetylase family protein [Microbacterium sp. H1-D42]|uniref:polysaccharide deacetylase family protein n=1 Tax=Microbacterium sp. H1-D42 TaxID=2925844 RepID=UPI001F53CB95|nr:polysaccharide deacetylase family protein [Microbacterium sp. H1-D42]UNK71352.1 polysaccharide deacetylase family protein [Microbacterium sp. H1-D42]
MPASLIERLGHPADTRAIILNADDFGMCRAANTAISELLDAGHLDSTTIMMPCSWAAGAASFAARRHDLDVGVHLVLTSEWDRYRWRPLTGILSSLVDADGYFPRTVLEVERQADEDDVVAELGLQVEAAIAAGIDVTHLDNHMGSVYGLETGRNFLGPVFALAASHGLPFRLPRYAQGYGLDPALQPVLDEATAAADAAGVVIPDRSWTHPFELVGDGTAQQQTYEDVRDDFIELLRAVPAGVTEVYLHPMFDGPGLRGTVDYAAVKRGYETRLLTDPVVAQTLADEGLIRIGWRALRDLQRGADAAPVDAVDGAPR